MGSKMYYFPFLFFLPSYLKLWNKEGNGSSTTAYRQRLGTHVGHLETLGFWNTGFGTETTQSFRLLWFFYLPFSFSFFCLYLSLCYLNTYTNIYHPRKVFTTNYESGVGERGFPICIPAKPEVAINSYKLFYSMDHVFLFYIMLSALKKLS